MVTCFILIAMGHSYSEAEIIKVRQSVKPLNLERVPSINELMAAGQLGGQLYPTHKTRDTKKASQENLEFGKAIQQWNEHEYDNSVNLFRSYVAQFPDSPWVSEARLHIGCDARYKGDYLEAEMQFKWIISNNKGKSHEGAIRLANKARQRLAIVKVLQNNNTEAEFHFAKLIEDSLSWRERTYASHWIQRISRNNANKTERANCGISALAYLLKKQGKAFEAKKILEEKPETENGHNISQIVDLAARYNFNLAGVQLTINDLLSTNLPAIVHVDHGSETGHYLVLESIENNEFFLKDLQNKNLIKQKRETFLRGWKGKAIVTTNNNESLVQDFSLVNITAENTHGGCCGIPAPEGSLGDPGMNAGGRNKNQCPTGAPVWTINMVNMNIFMTDIPLWYKPPVGPPVIIKLNYNSLSSIAYHEPFGNKWQFNYGSYLVVDTSDTVTIFMPDGRRDIYSPDGQGGYTKPQGVFNVLTKLGDNHFELEFTDGTVYEYNIPSGTSSLQPFLTKIIDRHGQFLTLNYDQDVQLITIADALNKVTTLIYNAEGLVDQINDPFGRSASFEYDDDRNLVKITDMGGIWTEISYDDNIYLTTLKNARGTWGFFVEPADGDGTTGNAYAPPGGITWEAYRITVTNPLGRKEEFFYDGDGGNISSYTSPKYYIPYLDDNQNNYHHNNKIKYHSSATYEKIVEINYPTGEQLIFDYDASTNKVNYIINSVADEHYFEYNSNGLVTKHIDPNYVETIIEYHPNGIDIHTIDNGLGPITFTYNSTHDIESITDRENNVTRYAYNAYGQLTQVIEAENTPIQRTTDYIYDTTSHELTEINTNGNTIAVFTHDNIGRIDSYTDASNVMVVYDYNDLNQIIEKGFPDNKSIVYSYSSCCPKLIDSITDRVGRTTEFLYDAMKQLTAAYSPDGVYKYEYDANGNVLKFIDPAQKETLFEYDAGDKLIKTTYANGDSISYTYDEAGFLSTITNGRGTTKTYYYGPDHRIASINYSDSTPTVSFYYDDYNRVENKVVDGFGVYQFGYNNNSMSTSIDGPWNNDTILYVYNELNQRVTLQIGDGVPITYSHDGLGRLEAIQTGAGSYSYEYNGTSSLAQKLTLPNGSYTDYLYNDPLKRLSAIINKKSTHELISHNTFTYTNQDVIGTERVTNGTPITSYQEGIVTYDYNDVNQLLSSTNPQKLFAYDADGNMTRGYTPDGFELTMAYDAENRLISSEYTDGSQITHRTEYLYSADSMLAVVKKFEGVTQVSETRIIRDSFLAVQDRNENNQIINEYSWATHSGGGIGGLLALKKSSNNYYYFYDGRGNAKGLIDQNQNIVATYSHSPFGILKEKAGTLSQPYQFSTKRLDEQTGLVYYGYRYYSPSVGRWISRDPIGLAGGDVNLYGFVRNNPINAIDPYGLQTGAPTIPGVPGFPPILPAVFLPGTPQNDAFVRDINNIINWLSGPDDPTDPQQWHDWAKNRDEETTCEIRQPEPSQPPGYDPENPPPDPNAPWWKKIVRIIMDAIRAWNP